MSDAQGGLGSQLRRIAERRGYNVLRNHDAPYNGEADFLIFTAEVDWSPPSRFAGVFGREDPRPQLAWMYARDAVHPVLTRYARFPIQESSDEYERFLSELPRSGDRIDLSAIITIRNGIRERISELEVVVEGAQRMVQQALTIALLESGPSDEETRQALQAVEELWRRVGVLGDTRYVEEVCETGAWSYPIRLATTNAMRHLGRRIRPLVAALTKLDRRRYLFDVVVNSLLVGREPPRWDEVRQLVESTEGILFQTETDQRQRRLLAIPSRMEYVAMLRDEDYTWEQAYDKLDEDWRKVGITEAFPYSGPESMRKSFKGYMKNQEQ